MTCAACGRDGADDDRFCAGCGTPLDGAHQETRKKVSLLFVDVVGSTSLAERLDPEPLRQIMDRFFAVCATCVAEHGGAVEKFIGDAVLAAFGALTAHEDDAVRAVRAAAGALEALRGLSAELADRYQVTLEARAGICTGDVVVITTSGAGFRVVGDPVSTASRLQTTAAPGEILLCADTASMARSEIGLEPVAPLKLRGKARPVPAWRVTGTAPGDQETGPAGPFVGRGEELEELRHAFRRAVLRRQVCLVTVLGVPGIGKSRLVREFLATLPDGEVAVLSGRCSAYGRGITYTPLAEMLGSYPGGWPALERLLVEDSGASSWAARSLATVVAGDGPTGVEDILWAARQLFEVLGRSGPVVVVWEDLHRAEETLLDLIDQVAAWLSGVPVLMLCVARTELLEARPRWGGERLELGPLSPEQSTELVGRLTLRGEVHAQEYDEVYERVAARCDGNPLFAELLLDVVAEAGPGVRIPPTIQAMLGARLDRLAPVERRVVEIAAVIGREFTLDVLQELAEADGLDRAALGDLTAGLVRRRVFQRGPDRTLRFAQALLRETAYAFTSKARRERWHDLLADWFARLPSDEMAVAYHVEASRRLGRELRPGDTGFPPLAGAAADILIAEGRAALNREDMPAAIQLLERGRELLAPGDPRHTVIAVHICDAGLWLCDQGLCLSALAAAEAALPGDARNAATCAVQRGLVELRLGLAPPAVVAADAALIAADLERDAGNRLGWCRLHQLEARLDLLAERAADAEAALRLGLGRAQAMDDRHEQDRLLCTICELALWTSTPVAIGLELCGLLTRRFAAGLALLVPVLVTRAHLEALGGDLPAARSTLADALVYSRVLRLHVADAAVMAAYGFVESLAGAHRAAEARYRTSLRVLAATRYAPDTQNTELAIARALFEQGRLDEAAAVVDGLEPVGLRARIGSGALRARIASARGRHEEAVAAAETACALGAGSDDPCLTGEALFDLAVVLRAAGSADRAAAEGAAAQRRFEAKGAALPAARVKAWLHA